MRVVVRSAMLMLPLALAACGGGGGVGVSYRAPGVRNYAAPGTSSDPWGPYIREAAAHYGIPEAFIREVMRQESGGHQYLNGELTTSSAGAMGLMQVMPATYATLSARYGLGPDPYDPHDNIMAGAALIRELYDQYGSPAFLAAYDAGPRRLDNYLAGRGALPNETIAYLDNVAPRLVGAGPMTGPLVAFAGTPGETPAAAPAPVEVAEASLPPVAPTVPESAPAPERLAPPPRPSRFALISGAYADTLAPDYSDARWGVQVGAFTNAGEAQQVAQTARGVAPAQLERARTVVATVTHPDGRMFYRSRLIGITEPAAGTACRTLASRHWPCLAVPPGG